MVKLYTKKSMIICGLCILAVAAIALVMHYGRVSDKDYKDVASVDNTPPVAAVPEEHDNVPPADEKKPSGTVNINIYSVDRLLDEIVEKYASEHWDFPYKINYTSDELVYSTEGLVRLTNDKLREGTAVDLYCIPAVYNQHYVKGEYSDYACPYEELGIDVDDALKKADIPQYAIEDGKNADGKIIALPYLGDVQVFVYRRSVAREIWGTDDPDKIAALIGGGTGKWDKLIEAAQTLKKHGYYIMSGNNNISGLIDTGIPDTDPEVYKNGSVTPKWDEFMELSKALFDKGYIKGTGPMEENWFVDLTGYGKNIFGYIMVTDHYEGRLNNSNDGDWAVCTPPFKIVSNYNTGIMVSKSSPNKDLLGPLIEWITLDSSKTGFQYKLASGTFDNQGKLSVISGTVLKNADTSRDILGGQNINPIVYDILQAPDGRHNDYSYGEVTLFHFLKETDAYIRGETDKDTAIANFVQKAGLSKPVLDPAADGDIVWKDENFERAVRNIIKKPNSSIKKSDVYGMTDLYISGNNIESIEDIVHFKNLKRFDCSANRITDISSLNALSGLEALFLVDNQISDISVLKELTSLKELNVSSNPITDISSLEGLTNLKELYIIADKISDITSLSGLTDLEVLEISQNNVSDIGAISKMKKLTQLHLWGNKIEDINPLKELTNLEKLYMGNNNISDITPLSKLTNLRELGMETNPISDISSIKKLKKLEALFVEGDNITDKSPASHVKNVYW